MLARLIARLRAEMEARDFRAAPLARAARLNEGAVRDILRGRSMNPGIFTLKAIADVMDISLLSLIQPAPRLPVAGVCDAKGSVRPAKERSTAAPPMFLDLAELQPAAQAIVVEDDDLPPLANAGDLLLFGGFELYDRERTGDQAVLIQQRSGLRIGCVKPANRLGDVLISSLDGGSASAAPKAAISVASLLGIAPRRICALYA